MSPAERAPKQSPEDDIEKLKHKLYSRADKDKLIEDIRTPLTQTEVETPVAWPKDEVPEEKEKEPPRPPLSQFLPVETRTGMSLPAKFLIGSVLFFVVAAGAAAYMFFGGGNLISPSNIDLQIIAPSLVDSGKAQTLQILIANRNTASLNLVDLLLDYPDGTRDPANPTQPLSHVRQSIGTINAGQQIAQTASALFYGQEGTQETVQATLEYSVAGSNAVFEKQTQVNFLIGSSPVSLSIDAPQNAVAGEQFPVDITVQSNTTQPVDNVVVQAQYPFGYSFASSNPGAVAGGTFWELGTLQPGASQVIHLVGTLSGTNGASTVFRFSAGSNTDPTDTTVEVPLLTVPQSVTVVQPFITGAISVNGMAGKNISVSAGAPLQGTITWQNNLPTAISNAQLSLTLSGPALDPSSVNSTTGFYQSQTSTITWTSAQEPSLAQIPPGGSGTLQFSFSTLPAGSGNVLITNPTINLNLAVQGTSAGNNNVPQQINSAASAQVSIASSISLVAQALHFSGSIANSGPMPPRAESNTSYTIVWT
ncbi:MAG: hypothetical protein ACRD4E_03930, partial [Bryobacteraceae bacterium]